MSKSLGNYIGFTEPPQEIFGKVMSISDPLMYRYFELLTDVSAAEIARWRIAVASGEMHPMKLKAQLGFQLVNDFHDEEAARQAQANFERVHQRREMPEQVCEIEVTLAERPPELKDGAPVLPDRILRIVDVLVQAGLAPSKSEARRLLKAGAVSIDGAKITDLEVPVPADKAEILLRCGKLHFRRIKIR
jgi:tyrosyl-tRNA synthetase